MLAPKGLHHTTVKNINKDLIAFVLNSDTPNITGEGLDFIYRERHGIVGHGFDPNEIYRIHFRSNCYALVIKVGELTHAA